MKLCPITWKIVGWNYLLSIVSYFEEMLNTYCVCVQVHVSQIEKQVYHILIHCKKNDNVLVQLCRAMEAIEIHILTANITSHGNYIFQTLIVQVICFIGFLPRSKITISCTTWVVNIILENIYLILRTIMNALYKHVKRW